jgi:hypothetical protein
MLNVIMLRDIMPNVFMFSVIMMNVIMILFQIWILAGNNSWHNSKASSKTLIKTENT